jgi:hypothetical protein
MSNKGFGVQSKRFNGRTLDILKKSYDHLTNKATFWDAATLRITILLIMIFSIRTLSIKDFYETVSISDNQNNYVLPLC